MTGVEILGLVAGAITTGSIVPQVIRVFKFRSARDVSLLFSVFLLVGQGIWLVYGAILGLVPVILWNILGMMLLAFLLYGKLKYGKEEAGPSSSRK